MRGTVLLLGVRINRIFFSCDLGSKLLTMQSFGDLGADTIFSVQHMRNIQSEAQ